MKKMWIVLLLLLLLPPVIAQQQYNLKLLAVQENSNGSLTGSGADLFLELKEGSGRVFLDTFPATKVDTQISTRFAKEIACNEFKLPCHKYDFIYTIKAQSNIIGGPSAGAAIAALTTIAVLDLDYSQDIAITGTINSGGIIGTVGGVQQKLEAAKELGLNTVLIAKGTSAPEEDTNETNSTSYFNLTKYGTENLSLEVVEVTDLDEVMFYLTGQRLNHKEVSIEENPEYTQIMGDLRQLLCGRVDKIESQLNKEGISVNETVVQRVKEQEGKAENATVKGDYYSAASYCFSANIALRSFYYQQKKPNLNTLWNRFSQLEQDAEDLDTDISEEPIETISDLQTYIIVKERLDDVQEQIAKFKELQNKKGEEFYSLLSYAEERYFSAQAWTNFFDMDGKKLLLDKAHLQQSCQQKISEAEDRHQYVSLFVGEFNTLDIGKRINSAKAALSEGEYELCLIKAIQAKGDANALLSAMGLRKEAFPEVLDSKAQAVKRVIAENSAEGKFPILGYSYYQYANSLKEQEPFTSLIYLEYAMEMSDLGLYFPEEKSFWEQLPEKVPVTEDMLWGFAVGVILTLLILYLLPKKKKGKKKKNQ